MEDLMMLGLMGIDAKGIFDLCDKANKLSEKDFQLFLCVVCDEYHAEHPDFNHIEAIKTVAEAVAKVNEEEGTYTRVTDNSAYFV
jgi:hypothetical protein